MNQHQMIHANIAIAVAGQQAQNTLNAVTSTPVKTQTSTVKPMYIKRIIEGVADEVSPIQFVAHSDRLDDWRDEHAEMLPDFGVDPYEVAHRFYKQIANGGWNETSCRTVLRESRRISTVDFGDTAELELYFEENGMSWLAIYEGYTNNLANIAQSVIAEIQFHSEKFAKLARSNRETFMRVVAELIETLFEEVARGEDWD